MLKRNFNRRRFLHLSALAATGTALAACAAAEAPAAAPQAAAPASPGGYQGEIEFWDWAHQPRVRFTEQLVQEWEAQHPGVVLKYNPLGWTDIETKLLTVATAGSGPAFSNIHFFWRYDLQRAGVLAPYPDDMFEWDKLISTPFTRDPETGHVYTCNFNYYCDQVYFNQDLLAADANGNITQVGCSMSDYWAREWLWHTLVYQQGGWLYNESGTEALWNSEEGVRALQFIKDFYHTFKIDSPDFLGSSDAFGNELAAMYIDQGYTAAGINDGFPQMEGRWSTAPTPTFTGRPDPSWGMQLPEEGYGVFNTFPPEVQELAFDYIQFMIGSDERRLDWAIIMGGPPDRLDLLDHPRLKEEDTGRVIETQAVTLPWRINYGERPIEAEKFWRVMFDEVILNNEEPKVALDSATEQMNAALRESGKRRLIVERNFRPPTS
jgi:ABC-type glycerol-3-phosphate transport system substrate-binding protein